MTLLDGLRAYAQRHGGLVRLGVQNTDPIGEIRTFGYEASDQRLRALLSDLAAQGVIQRPARGMYLVPDAFGRVSRWAVASELAGPHGYLSLWSAADYHRLTTSQVGWLSVVGDKAQPSVDLGQLGSVVFHATQSHRLFGAQEIEDGGTYARVARIERMLIDLLWFPDGEEAPSSQETYIIWQAAVRKGINGPLLVDYTRRMKAGRLTRRVGYLMDLLGINGSEALAGLIGGEKEYISAIPGRGGATFTTSTKWRIGGE